MKLFSTLQVLFTVVILISGAFSMVTTAGMPASKTENQHPCHDTAERQQQPQSETAHGGLCKNCTMGCCVAELPVAVIPYQPHNVVTYEIFNPRVQTEFTQMPLADPPRA